MPLPLEIIEVKPVTPDFTGKVVVLRQLSQSRFAVDLLNVALVLLSSVEPAP